MVNLLILIALLTSLLATITPGSITEKPPISCFEEATELFIEGNIAFTGKIFKEMFQAYPGENLFASGPVMMLLLAELAVNADPYGDTYQQIMKTLHYNDVKYIKCFFNIVLPMVTSSKEYQLIAKIYSDTHCPLTNQFLEESKELFVYGAQNLDFSDPRSASIINEEMAIGTGGNILDFITPCVLSSCRGLLLASAEYFKATWVSPFNRQYTQLRDFFLSSTEYIKIPTMFQRGTFLYNDCPEFRARMLQLNYTGNQFSLLIVNPYEPQDMLNVIEKIGDINALMAALRSLHPEDVEIYLPTFNMTRSHMMKSYVEKAHVSAIFSNETSGLSRITTCSSTYVCQILQKESLQVDETGTGNDGRCDENLEDEDSVPVEGGNPIVFRVNQPFIYLLFYGQYMVFFGVFVY